MQSGLKMMNVFCINPPIKRLGRKMGSLILSPWHPLKDQNIAEAAAPWRPGMRNRFGPMLSFTNTKKKKRESWLTGSIRRENGRAHSGLSLFFNRSIP
jgi:hypothetical protein